MRVTDHREGRQDEDATVEHYHNSVDHRLFPLPIDKIGALSLNVGRPKSGVHLITAFRRVLPYHARRIVKSTFDMFQGKYLETSSQFPRILRKIRRRLHTTPLAWYTIRWDENLHANLMIAFSLCHSTNFRTFRMN